MTPQELKSSILQLAIRGKLVAQTPQDGFSETIKNKSISKDSDEIPYDIPDTWHWCRLEDLATLYNGRAYKKPEMLVEGKYPLLRVGNLFTSDTWYYSDLELEPEKYCDNGDLLYAWSASFGPYIWNGGKVIYHYHIWKLDLCYPQTRDYLYWVLAAQTDAIKRGGHGSTMIHITKAGTEKMLIPVPPLAEQKRIVAKIEELLPLIDRYEQAWSKLEDFNKRFPVDMQKSILQMAIQGKLVEQRPEEGTGEELFQQIQAEKQKLIKAGKIKKEKPLPEILDDEIPFDIPESWKWARFSDVLDVRDGTHDTPKYVISGIPLVTSKNLVDGEIDFETTKLISIEDAQAINMRSAVDDGDILFAMIGTIGNPILVKKDREFCIKNMALFKAVNHDLFSMDYLLLYLQNEQHSMKKKANGGVQSFVSLGFLRNYLLPLPPLAEQERIVAKLEEILPLCERLK